MEDFAAISDPQNVICKNDGKLLMSKQLHKYWRDRAAKKKAVVYKGTKASNPSGCIGYDKVDPKEPIWV